MNKYICDICGTAYPESADRCPICGSSREFSTDDQEYIPEKMPPYVPSGTKKSGLFLSAVKKVQDDLYDKDDADDISFDAPMDILPELEDHPVPMGTEHSDRRRTNYFVVILLTIVIGLCVLASGFLFFRYYLPHQFPQETEPEVTTSEPTEVTEESQLQTIPCKSIVLTSGVPEINRLGQYWLLHVIVVPEDTTDQLTFVSSDESVVTVTQEGRLCAVGEGKTTVVISCGEEQILCQVTVKLPEETGPSADPSTETTSAEEPSEETEAAGEVILKLKQSDISFSKKGVTFELELDCDLDPKDVTWMTMDPDVAICHDGVITVLGNGTTRIVAQYKGQEVYCIVRCSFK